MPKHPLPIRKKTSNLSKRDNKELVIEAFFNAAARGKPNDVRFINENIHSLTARDLNSSINGYNVLHLAAYYGHASIANTLINSKKIDLNAANGDGYTALTLASCETSDNPPASVLEYKVRIVKAMIEAGADLSITSLDPEDGTQKTAEMWARKEAQTTTGKRKERLTQIADLLKNATPQDLPEAVNEAAPNEDAPVPVDPVQDAAQALLLLVTSVQAEPQRSVSRLETRAYQNATTPNTGTPLASGLTVEINKGL